MKLIASMFCLLLLAGWRSPEPGGIVLRFENRAGNEVLIPGNTYVLRNGDTVTPYRFKYYISRIKAVSGDGRSVSLSDEHYLIDAADSASQVIALKDPGFPVAMISFVIGVDSIRNVSGVQTGALDPLHGMFWTWNSGYVMAKLEGSSPASHIAGRQFTYHVGGYRDENNTTRTVQLHLPDGMNQQNITVIADINAWFSGKNKIRISSTPVCHSPGELAMQLADNYSTMFSIARP
ncbi:MbnP family protein [Sediminibacterium ginsengisoli]|uniref:Copper-binding protein MbnP-like domain-containing protein n=1 Tax=Sediminibacterium ginsengisoli TaxID=413434 RepID=A0A1T4K0Q6_9BACT|nr:MbnP family protein [Sediminibacterium ginsengisoli]SJZ36056.1 hypothetical protein SAMN04488132_101376 [Sediminibacterium ginsengisoli]